jgi:hypothetical protein
LGPRKDTKVTTDRADLHRKTATLKIRTKIRVEKSREKIQKIQKNFRHRFVFAVKDKVSFDKKVRMVENGHGLTPCFLRHGLTQDLHCSDGNLKQRENDKKSK